MPEKHPSKTLEVEPSVTPLLIAENDRLAPYIQVFVHQPENIAQRAMGVLCGILKIDDIGVDSAFVVNFLASELKKEYYGNPRRTPAGSFEAGLNRLNIALSELAKQGNIAWIGKIEGALCALEKNGMLHFSTTGSSRILLIREQIASSISDGLSPEAETPNPLKTFVEISSGKLHPDDIVILSSHELFDFLPLERIEQSVRRFTYPELNRFLHTALVNEFDFCGAVTIQTKKKVANAKNSKKAPKKPSISPEAPPNLWGADIFRDKRTPSPASQDTQAQSEPTSTKESAHHLYIQQELSSAMEPKQELREKFLLAKEHIANTVDEWVITSRTSFRQWSRRLAKKLSKKSNDSSSSINVENQIETSIPSATTPPDANTTLVARQKIVTRSKSTSPTPQDVLPAKQNNILPSSKKPSPKSSLPSQTPPASQFTTPTPTKKPLSLADQKQAELKKSIAELAKLARDIFTNLHLLEKIKNTSQSVTKFLKGTVDSLKNHSKKTPSALYESSNRFISWTTSSWKYLAIGAGILVALLLIWGFLSSSKKPEEGEVIPEETPEINKTPEEIRRELFANEPNTRFLEPQNLITLYTTENTIIDTFALNDQTILALEENAVAVIPNDGQMESFPLSNGNTRAVAGAYMNDLSLLFILTENGQVTSFSPISKKYSENTLTLENASSGNILIGAYLTYLYVANTDTNSILRYPRSEETGGFGSPTPWLGTDSGVSIAEANDMTIDGSIYLSKTDSVIRLENRGESPLTLAPSSLDSNLVSIFTPQEDAPLAFTDAGNNRVILYNKDGSVKENIIAPFVDPILTNVVFSASDASTLFITTRNEIQKVSR